MSREERLEHALREVLKLIDSGVLVRDTSMDSDVMAFIRQGILITNTLYLAQDALYGGVK